MKVLLTGATGFLGFRTLEQLAADDSVSALIATGRSLKDTHKVHHPKVRYVLGDLSDAFFAESLTKEADIIIHAAALSSPWGKRDEFYTANVVPQKNLIYAAKKNGVKRFIYVSTPSLYFNKKDRYNIKESDPLPSRFINEYAATKREAEIELENSGLSYVILRPRALTGRGDTIIMPRLIRAYEEGKLRIIGNGKNKVDITSVANVVQAILLSIKTEKGINKTYNISNGEPIQLWEAIAMVLTKLNYAPPKKKIPYGIVVRLAHLMEIKSRLGSGKEPALTRYGVGTLAKNFTMDISKAKEFLGYEPVVTNEQAIDEFVNWYKTMK